MVWLIDLPAMEAGAFVPVPPPPPPLSSSSQPVSHTHAITRLSMPANHLRLFPFFIFIFLSFVSNRVLIILSALTQAMGSSLHSHSQCHSTTPSLPFPRA